VEPAAICLTAAVRRTGTRHDRRGPTRRPDRRLARDRRHRRPRSGASTGHCGTTVSTGPRCSSPPSTWGCRPRRPPEATGYSPPCRRCSPAAQGSTWPGRAGRVPVAGQPTASSSRAPISRVSGPRSGAVADQVGGRRRVDQGKCLDEHIWCLVAAEPAGEGQPRRGESLQRRGGQAFHRRAPVAQPAVVQADPRRPRAGRRPAGEEQAGPPCRIPGPRRVVASRPGHLVVLAGHQRHVRRQGPYRGPPGAHHVGVHQARARRRPQSRRSPALPGIWPRPRRPGARARRPALTGEGRQATGTDTAALRRSDPWSAPARSAA
jgi:hypothetical protein